MNELQSDDFYIPEFALSVMFPQPKAELDGCHIEKEDDFVLKTDGWCEYLPELIAE